MLFGVAEALKVSLGASVAHEKGEIQPSVQSSCELSRARGHSRGTLRATVPSISWSPPQEMGCVAQS